MAMALINLTIEKPAFKREDIVVADEEGVDVEKAADDAETVDVEEATEESTDESDIQHSGSKLRRGAGIVTVATVGIVGLLTFRKARRFRKNRDSDD